MATETSIRARAKADDVVQAVGFHQLSGKTGVGVVVWLISWALLNLVWKDKEYYPHRASLITLIFVSVGVILTFPPVFEAFE